MFHALLGPGWSFSKFPKILQRIVILPLNTPLVSLIPLLTQDVLGMKEFGVESFEWPIRGSSS
jgi:hypothetical protein